MIDYIKKNHLGVLIIAFLVVSAIFSGDNMKKGDLANLLGSINRATTTITNPQTFQEGITLNANSNKTAKTLIVSGTTTIAMSYDGFVAYAGFTVATGTAKAVYTNNTGANMMCDADSGFIEAIGTTFAPTLTIAIGTSTSATGYATNLMASTTLATTTSPVLSFTYATPFKLATTESIVAALDDLDYATASSTYYSNWSMQFGVHCWLMGA